MSHPDLPPTDPRLPQRRRPAPVGHAGPEPVDADPWRASAVLLDQLGLPPRFTLVELHASVEQRRGRPVHLLARDLPPSAPHGVWVATDDADYLVYDGSAPEERRHQLIAHELGHVLFDHGTTPSRAERVAAQLLPRNVPPGLRQVRGRICYDERAEQRAEVFGTVVVERLHSWRRPTPTAEPDIFTRMADALRTPEDPAPPQQPGRPAPG
jgi:hypothetical protein